MTPPTDSKRALILVGVYINDWQDDRFRATVIPVIAGITDGTVWDMETDDETQARWAKCKEAFDPGGGSYEWREVWITLDEDGLRAPFEVPEIKAQIEGGDANAPR